MTHPGGKAGAGVYQAIINQVPPFTRLIEPFAGDAAIFRNIRPGRNPAILIEKDPVKALELQDEFEGCPVDLYQGCGINFLVSNRSRRTDFIFADPPYLPGSTKGPLRYRHNLSREDHRWMIRVLKEQPAWVMLCGYPSELYDQELADWRHIEISTPTHGGPAITTLWMNYPEPEVLHDYRYLGDDYREREDIKRQIQRWQKRLWKMTTKRQKAMLSALLERKG